MIFFIIYIIVSLVILLNKRITNIFGDNDYCVFPFIWCGFRGKNFNKKRITEIDVTTSGKYWSGLKEKTSIFIDMSKY